MTPTRKLSRRSFFAAVGGVAAVAVTVGVAIPEEAEAQSGCTDSDSGRYADGVGHGRRCYRRRTYYNRRRHCTDSDTGRYMDGVGHGRRC